MKIHEIRETRAGKVAEMQSIVSKAETEKRELAGNEAERFDALKGEVRNLEAQLGRAETLAEMERHADATAITGDGRGAGDLERRFSVGKALAEFTATGKMTGAEGEYAAEHRSDRSGAFRVPFAAVMGERRAVLTTTPVAGPGGNLVATNVGPIIDRPRPVLASERLGATLLTGLTGNLRLPKLAASGSAAWVPEHGPVPGSDPKFGALDLTPKTVGAKYEVSRRMLIQAAQVEQILRADLSQLLSAALDQAAFVGIGTNNVPQGITRTPGVRKVAGLFADPLKPTVGEIDNLLSTMVGVVEAADIAGTRGFVGHPAIRATLARYRGADGVNIGVNGFMQGETALWSTQFPANGGVNTNLATLVYGQFSDLIIAVFGTGIDILPDPFSAGDTGGLILRAFLDADIGVRHPEAFSFTDAFPTTALTSTVVA